jgi:hypothetical protein
MSAHSTKELSSSNTLFTATLRAKKQDSSASEHGTPDVSRAPERFLLKMPQNLHSYDKQIYLSEGFGDQGSLCQPIDEGQEHELISSMIDELNTKCGLELSHEFSLYRPSITSEPDREDVTEGQLERVVLVGGGHSSSVSRRLFLLPHREKPSPQILITIKKCSVTQQERIKKNMAQMSCMFGEIIKKL